VSVRELSESIIARSKLFEQVVSACQRLLYTDEAKEVREYAFSRFSRHSLEKYQVGYFPPNNRLDSLRELVDKNTLETLRLAYRKNLKGRGFTYQADFGLLNHHPLVIPFRDEYGNIIALAGRTLLNEDEQRSLEIGKYKNTFYEKSLHLFGVPYAKGAIERSNSAIIVEGQIDCISCHANGFHNVVALTGSGLSDYQVYLLKKMAKTIYLLLDNDKAGQKAKSRIISNFSKDLDIKEVEVPPNFEDVDEYLKSSPTYDIFDQCRTVNL
jgi:DNA primase